jgi:catechol 2,3-dioxygenase-like lactoylglutathione lyase family enzyme
MAACFIDHITVTAPNLEVGEEFVRQALGVTPVKGGEHPRMGTHNSLLRLGDTMFLEVIAPNPGAPRPDRPRWFVLDDLAVDSPPRLSTWVVRSTDIQATAADALESLGAIEPMSRGTLDWRITIPADGSVPQGGVAPALIQWQAAQHPAAGMRDWGLSLLALELFHPDPDRVRALLDSIELDGPVLVLPLPKGAPAYMVATINTPDGVRKVSGLTDAN